VTALAFHRVVKDYRGLRPLRIADLEVGMRERVAIAGLDVPAAETFINLATGAGLPDAGQVRVMEEPTSAITDGDGWLASLDRFGIISHRAVLLDAASVAQNIAMSYSLAIDPIPGEIRAQVDALALAVGLEPSMMDAPLAAAGPAAKVRTHLARALALDPKVVIFEHATLGVPREDVAGLAASIVGATEGRDLAVVALTDDAVLAKGLKGRRLKLDAATGQINGDRPHLFTWFRE
jgi:predicted ABC-type transport system involved in lysophospholipase L1 biosynthesis ATPase subunit